MAMGRQAERQGELMVTWSEMPRSPGHVFYDYDRLQDVLLGGGFDAFEAAPSADQPSEGIADKGYHSRERLKSLEGGAWKTRIAEPERKGFCRWHGDEAGRRAVYNNRTRLRSELGKEVRKRRAEIVERSFAHVLDRGGMRRTWLRGRENVHKRTLLHVAGHNLGLLMRRLSGAGTPREAMARGKALVLLVPSPDGSVLVLIAAIAGNHAFIIAFVA